MKYYTIESRVSSDIQTRRSWLKASAIASFFNSLLGVRIVDETLLLVCDMLLGSNSDYSEHPIHKLVLRFHL